MTWEHLQRGRWIETALGKTEDMEAPEGSLVAAVVERRGQIYSHLRGKINRIPGERFGAGGVEEASEVDRSGVSSPSWLLEDQQINAAALGGCG